MEGRTGRVPGAALEPARDCSQRFLSCTQGFCQPLLQRFQSSQNALAD